VGGVNIYCENHGHAGAITVIGKIFGKVLNPDAREYGTAVYLCEFPKISFNEFWINRLRNL
jgi:hypothetical protein